MKKIFVTMVLLAGFSVSAQIKIGANSTTLNTGSLLELESSDKGLKFPQFALTSTTIAAPLAGGVHVAGMTVYNTATAGDVTPGLYTNNGTVWVKLGGATPSYQNITGNVQTLTTVGTITDDTYLVFYSSSSNNILATPTPAIGKTLYVRNISTGVATVAGQSVNPGKGRCFVSDGVSWFIILP